MSSPLFSLLAGKLFDLQRAAGQAGRLDLAGLAVWSLMQKDLLGVVAAEKQKDRQPLVAELVLHIVDWVLHIAGRSLGSGLAGRYPRRVLFAQQYQWCSDLGRFYPAIFDK